MFHLILTIHLILCVALIGLVLLQQGKGADVGATFGGGNNTLFGAGGAVNMITKITTTVAISFMITSILLVRAYGERGHVTAEHGTVAPLAGSVMEGVAVKKEEPKTETAQPAEPVQKSIDATAAGVAAPKVETNAPAAPLVESGAAQQVVIPPAGTDKATDAAAKVDSSSVSKKPSKGTAKAAKAK